MDLLPKVYRTEGSIADFDPSKIYESILKETGMNESNVKHITELVVRRIISSGIKFLSGPHIREIVCSILSEQHFENERKLYTRIGMPLMDYEEILERGLYNRLNGQINPETIHHWAANQISEEYAHLRILTNEESKAHLAGDIHINGLNYFDLRPFIQLWDPRLVLENGFPPFDNITLYYPEKPAVNLITALNHLSKWLGMVQSEFYGTQGFNFLTTFLAPYIKHLSQDKIDQELQKFIYDLSQLSILLGKKITQISVSSYYSTFKSFSEFPVIVPNIKNKQVYGIYQEDCLKLFKGLINIYNKIEDNKTALLPKLQLILDDKFLEEIENNYSNFWEEVQKVNSIYFTNYCLNTNKNLFLKRNLGSTYINYGFLQNISLNLPRYAYLSKNEDDFFEILRSKINLCSDILNKKYNIIEKRIVSNHLPFCSGKVNGKSIFKLKDQNLSISLIGLNEAIKFLTNYELHEHSEAIKLSKKVLNEINKLCSKLSEINKRNFVLTENSSFKAIQRFTELDLKHYPDQVKSIINDTIDSYTNSVHFRNEAVIDLCNRIDIQGEFHCLMHYGAIEYISFNDLKAHDITLKDFLSKICNDSSVSSLKFYS
ncbi:MAG: anaerobic ribonucleoside-triphosphate reductase [Candidatus Hermodarchaeota archaeon]